MVYFLYVLEINIELVMVLGLLFFFGGWLGIIFVVVVYIIWDV